MTLFSLFEDPTKNVRGCFDLIANTSAGSVLALDIFIFITVSDPNVSSVLEIFSCYEYISILV